MPNSKKEKKTNFTFNLNKTQTHLVEDGLDLVEQALGTQRLDVRLLEVDALVVQTLQVILLVLLPPYLVEALLRLPPLLLLGLEASQDDGHRHRRVPLQALDDVGRLVAVYPPDGPLVEGGRVAAQAVVQLVLGRLVGVHAVQFLLYSWTGGSSRVRDGGLRRVLHRFQIVRCEFNIQNDPLTNLRIVMSLAKFRRKV